MRRTVGFMGMGKRRLKRLRNDEKIGEIEDFLRKHRGNLPRKGKGFFGSIAKRHRGKDVSLSGKRRTATSARHASPIGEAHLFYI